MESSIHQELRARLRTFTVEYSRKKEPVHPEDVESLIHFAELLHLEEKLLEAVKENTDGNFWGFLRMLVDSVPPDTFPIIEDGDVEDDEDEDEDEDENENCKT